MAEMNRRILLIDDTASIHEDFKKILTQEESKSSSGLADVKAAFFGDDVEQETTQSPSFELDSALQGKDGLELVKQAVEEEKPYAMAFVDIRMPPGWDGLRTIEEIWKVDPDIQMVICTAYSDYSWEQTIEKLGSSDHLLILKKPFDSVEISQLASALTEKWNVAKRESQLIEDLRTAEQQARAYASSLETVNRALMTSKASTDRSTELKSHFLVHLSDQIHGNLGSILELVAGVRESEDIRAPEKLDGILDASAHLIRIFDEILDLTRLETGQLTLSPTDCSLAELMTEIDAQFREQAESNNTRLEFKIQGSVPETIQADPVRFRQILEQLVENSLEHSGAQNVVVSFETQPTQDWRSATLLCRVQDDGCGVDPQFHGKLFEPFVATQQPEEGRQALRNPGLGLALAKQLAHLMGGELNLDSGGSTGSAFTLRLDTGPVDGVRMLDESFRIGSTETV